MEELSHIAKDLWGLAVPIESVHVDPNNARTGHAVGRIAASLEEFGQRKPIVANRAEGGKVEAGNGTLAAALKLGWKKVAVVWVEDDAAAAAAFGIADNRVGEFSDWSLDELMDGLDVAGDLFTGFEAFEVEELVGDLGRTGLGDGAGGGCAGSAGRSAEVDSGDRWRAVVPDGRVVCGLFDGMDCGARPAVPGGCGAAGRV